MGKMRNSNLFLKYHCSINAFAEIIRKKMAREYGITSSEFSVLSVGYLMQYKKGFFTRKFIINVRQIDQSVIFRLMRSLKEKGLIEKTGRIRNYVLWQTTDLGLKAIKYYSKAYMEIIDDFEEEHWKLNIY